MLLEKMDEFFNARAETYDNHMLVDLALDEFYEEIAAHISPVSPNFRMLDLGCGTGLELVSLFKKYPDMQVTGIDMSTAMLNRLQMKFPNKSLNLICGSYFDVSFNGKYDVALSTYSLHHFDIPFTAENEIRLMKEAGFHSIQVVRRWENTSIIIGEVG